MLDGKGESESANEWHIYCNCVYLTRNTCAVCWLMVKNVAYIIYDVFRCDVYIHCVSFHYIHHRFGSSLTIHIVYVNVKCFALLLCFRFPDAFQQKMQ